MLKQIRNIFFIDQEKYPFEIRFILYISLVAGAFSFLSIYMSSVLNLGLELIIVHIATAIAYGTIYYLGRFRRVELLVKRLMTITTLIFINILWFMNFGSHGPVPFIFIVFYSILTFIWDQKSLIWITFVLLINLFVLFLLDVYYPNMVKPYPTEMARMIDFYLGLIFYLALVFVLSYVASKNYMSEYEKAKRSDQLKSAFLANMSHEIRTPLNSIVGFSELLCDEDLPMDKRERFVNIIQENNQNLLRLIEDILDISRIESNQLKIELEPLNLKELHTNLETTYSNLVKSKKDTKSVEVILDQPVPEFFIETDGSRLHQILVNLLDNALKFTENGEIHFGYVVKGNKIEFHVSDSGIGIKEEHIEKLFDRFYKIEPGNGKLYKGTGIGLSLCKDLIQLLGGRIWVESTYGKGSTFYFTLPKN